MARQLRRDQTAEEKQLWKELRGRRFAGFKFRRQHIVEGQILDFYCFEAKLAVELDGFQHGLPDGLERDEKRERILKDHGIESLRFWNHQWWNNRRGCLLEIWNALQRRSGLVRNLTKAEDQKFIPPDLKGVQMRELTDPSPRPSPRLAGRGR